MVRRVEISRCTTVETSIEEFVVPIVEILLYSCYSKIKHMFSQNMALVIT